MKKRFLAGFLACFVLAWVSGCGSASKNASADTAAFNADIQEIAVEEESAEMPAAREEAAAGAVTSENGIEPLTENGQKLIKTVYLELQTKEFDVLQEELSAKVKELGGYIERSSVAGNSYYYESTRNASYTIRVPSDRLEEFVDVAGKLGNVTRKTEEVEDVTLQYVDTENRKKALETEQERLLELLEQAENMEDLLIIESKLSEVRYELENYGSQLRLLDNQIDYSTVDVYIEEVEHITEAGERSFLEEIGDRFSDSLYKVGRGIRGFTVGFLGSLPILAVWAALIGGIVLIIRWVRVRKKKKKARENDLQVDP